MKLMAELTRFVYKRVSDKRRQRRARQVGHLTSIGRVGVTMGAAPKPVLAIDDHEQMDNDPAESR